MGRSFTFGIAASMILAASTTDTAAQQPAPGNRGGGRGTPIAPGDTACPAGQTEIRPRQCMAPQLPPPSILDYRPRSTLVADAHLVKTAKYPAIDFHGHPNALIFSVDGLATLGPALDSLNRKSTRLNSSHANIS